MVGVGKFLAGDKPVFKKNQPLGPMPSTEVKKSIVLTCMQYFAERTGNNPFKTELFGDVECSEQYINWMEGKIPCLLASHYLGCWSIKRGRRLSLSERSRLIHQHVHPSMPPLAFTIEF